MEAIILAGGLGTRLREAVSDLPKSMAPINGSPFLETLLDYLITHGIKKIILSVGYKSEAIKNHFGQVYKNCKIIYSVEETQLGTGGAIALAMQFVSGKNVIVANGDTVLLADVTAMLESHKASNADATLALKPMKNFERYGTVKLDSQNRITAFVEKRNIAKGLINAGFYIFNVAAFLKLEMPQKFSLEKEIFEAKISQLYFNGFITNGYFIDIGIPVDFQKAQIDLGCLLRANKNWTLFLDRDGVINKKIDNDYVRNLNQFHILPGALAAIEKFSSVFGKIIVVTNQQGVGKGLMSAADVEMIHENLKCQVIEKGGRIDAFYFAPQRAAEKSFMRKPMPGMAHNAKEDFPEIDFRRSIMVGDSKSDMEFAERAGMAHVYITKALTFENYYCISSLIKLSERLSELQSVLNT